MLVYGATAQTQVSGRLSSTGVDRRKILRRLIESGGICPTTRVILEGAVKALESELESVSAG